jgi:hypothetical protein
MPESITINIVGQEVGIQYHPETSEAEFRDEMLARELGLHALAVQAILHRQQQGVPVPAVLIAVAQAHTFRELV